MTIIADKSTPTTAPTTAPAMTPASDVFDEELEDVPATAGDAEALEVGVVEIDEDV